MRAPSSASLFGGSGSRFRRQGTNVDLCQGMIRQFVYLAESGVLREDPRVSEGPIRLSISHSQKIDKQYEGKERVKRRPPPFHRENAEQLLTSPCGTK